MGNSNTQPELLEWLREKHPEESAGSAVSSSGLLSTGDRAPAAGPPRAAEMKDLEHL